MSGRAKSRTTATIVLMVLGLYVLAILARPYTAYRLVLLLAMIALFLGALLIPFVQDFFKLELPRYEHPAAGPRRRGRRLCRVGAGDPGGAAVERGARGEAGAPGAGYSQPRFLNATQRITVASAMIPSATK